jgi:radical SAM protein with 4Fe4S-binding SPASM domain
MTNYESYRNDKVLFYLEGIRNGTRKFPPSLQIAVTDHCYNKCIMCGHWKREDKRQLPISDLLHFLVAAKSIGLETVCYSGGDPLCYSNMSSVMAWHTSNDMPFGIITSGFIPRHIEPGLLMQAEWVRVSLDAVDDALYAKLRGNIPVKIVKESIQRMVEWGTNVQFGVTLSSLNCSHLPEIAKYAAQYGIEFRVWPVRGNPGLLPESSHAKMSLKACKGILGSINNNCEDAIDIIENGELAPFEHCKAALFQLFIDASGDIYPCCIIAGDANDGALRPDMAFGNIKDCDLDGMLFASTTHFSEIPSGYLPSACSGCTKRLQSINLVAAKHWNDKHFV